jgi:hypothetical protein
MKVTVRVTLEADAATPTVVDEVFTAREEQRNGIRR